MPITLADFERDALPTLSELVATPALSPQFDADWADTGHLERAVQILAEWSRQRSIGDLTVEIARLPQRTPTLVVTVGATAPGDGDGDGDEPTVVLYGHYDKQPPLGDWSPGLSPWEPVRRGNRLYGRGAADDGYALFAALTAIESLEREGRPHARCVILIEGSEESGSSDLEYYLDDLAGHLGRVELMVCLDSGSFTYDRLWVTNSLRGVVNVEITVSVLERGVHSGSASGIVPSSFRVLRQLLDRVEDAATGEILLPELHAAIPASHRASAAALAAEFGDVYATSMPTVPGLDLQGTDAADRLLRRAWYPTLSVVGMGGIPAPEIAGNVLRPFTTAVLSFRLPPTVDAAVAVAAIERALSHDVPSHAHVELVFHPGDGWAAAELAPWLSAALDDASRSAFGRAAGFTGEGGSIPFLAELGRRYPDAQFVATGAAGPDSNPHGIDEMVDLDAVVGVTNAVATIVAAHAAR